LTIAMSAVDKGGFFNVGEARFPFIFSFMRVVFML